MTIEDLIKKYEEELKDCEVRINSAVKSTQYSMAQNWKINKIVVQEFLNDLKAL
ncbi:hypothetical protein ACFFVB_18310 [Formosa undariae]|uniref:Uncharacterized protein n=1 Tax=Formosa undariae TaxID=1325436 RepID=A0ABV5F6K7_9FLAO